MYQNVWKRCWLVQNHTSSLHLFGRCPLCLRPSSSHVAEQLSIFTAVITKWSFDQIVRLLIFFLLFLRLPSFSSQVVVKPSCHKPLAGWVGPSFLSSLRREMECGWSAGVYISLGELAVQANEAESLFMELRIIFMIISTFSGSAARQNPASVQA